MDVSASNKFDLLIAGGGMAGQRLLQDLAERRFAGRIAWISAESVAGYNRVLLPELLAGHCPRDELLAKPVVLDLTLFANRRLLSVDTSASAVSLEGDVVLSYQALVVATGATPRRPNVSGSDLPGVGALRTLADVERLSRLGVSDSVVVVGGGLLGLEAATALHARGVSVTVMHRHQQLLNRNLDQRGAGFLLQLLKQRGIRVLCSSQPIELKEETGGLSVITDSGGVIKASEVLFAVGTEVTNSVFGYSNGVPVNNRLQTIERNVYALGECALVDGVRYGQVDAVFAQARTIAEQLCGSASTFVAPQQVTRLKVPGLDLLSLGNFGDQNQGNSTLMCLEDAARGVYRALHLVDNQLSSAVLLGDVQGSRAIQDRLDTTLSADDRESLLFGLEAA